MTDLVEAARSEVASREKHYPAMIASGRTELLVDYQAWCCILGWLSGGHFQTLDCGGTDEKTRIGWAEAEAAADRAVISVGVAIEDAKDPAKRDRLEQRHAGLVAIRRKVALRRATIDDLNTHFHRQREARKAA